MATLLSFAYHLHQFLASFPFHSFPFQSSFLTVSTAKSDSWILIFFFYHSVTLCLLMGGGGYSFTFKVIIDKEGLTIAILLLNLSCMVFYPSFPLLLSSFVFHWSFCIDKLLFLSLFLLCKSYRHFVITMGHI
jgi:hypothetical protein